MKDEIFLLCDRIRECAFSLHRHLRHGHAEKVHEHGLLINFGAPKLEIRKFALSDSV